MRPLRSVVDFITEVRWQEEKCYGHKKMIVQKKE